MRVENAGARTWLCVAFAGWAVCVWVLALLGMGGSIDRLDDDPSLRQALPSPGARAPERLGPLARYGDIIGRPLFSEDRRPQPFVIDPMGEAEQARDGFDYVLTSVLRTPDLQMVILQPAGGGEPQRVRLGEAPADAPGWVLQSVEARRALFAGPEGPRRLELRVFDGEGGLPPAPSPADPEAATDAGAAAEAAGAGTPDPATAEQQRAAQEQLEAIRRRIEERRERLRQQDAAQPQPRANQNP